MEDIINELDQNLSNFEEKVKPYLQTYKVLEENNRKLMDFIEPKFEGFRGGFMITNMPDPFDSNSFKDSTISFNKIEDPKMSTEKWMTMQYHSISIHIYEIFEYHIKNLCKFVPDNNHGRKNNGLKTCMDYLNDKFDPELNKKYLLLNNMNRMSYYQILFYEKLRHQMVHTGGALDLIEFTKKTLKDFGADLSKDEKLSLDDKTINPELLKKYEKLFCEFECSEFVRYKKFNKASEYFANKSLIKWIILIYSDMFINDTGLIINRRIDFHIHKKAAFQILFEAIIGYMKIQTVALKELLTDKKKCKN